MEARSRRRKRMEHETEDEEDLQENHNKAERRSRAGAGGIDVGLNHMTKVFDESGSHVGWEIKCYHPGHQWPRACRKPLSSHTMTVPASSSS